MVDFGCLALHFSCLLLHLLSLPLFENCLFRGGLSWFVFWDRGLCSGPEVQLCLADHLMVLKHYLCIFCIWVVQWAGGSFDKPFLPGYHWALSSDDIDVFGFDFMVVQPFNILWGPVYIILGEFNLKWCTVADRDQEHGLALAGSSRVPRWGKFGFVRWCGPSSWLVDWECSLLLWWGILWQ